MFWQRALLAILGIFLSGAPSYCKSDCPTQLTDQWKIKKKQHGQDPESTLQTTRWTNYYSFAALQQMISPNVGGESTATPAQFYWPLLTPADPFQDQSLWQMMSSTSRGKASLSSTNSKMYVGSSTYFSSEVFPFIKLSQTVLLQAELWCRRSGAPGFLRPSCRGRRCQGRAQGASPCGESAVMPIYKSLKSGASFHFYIYCARPLKYAHLTKERCTLTRCAPARWTDFVKLFSHSNEICFWCLCFFSNFPQRVS